MNKFAAGTKVVYRAPHTPNTEPGEEGVVTRDPGALNVFVRFGNDVHAKSTPRYLLEPISKTIQEEVDA